MAVSRSHQALQAGLLAVVAYAVLLCMLGVDHHLTGSLHAPAGEVQHEGQGPVKLDMAAVGGSEPRQLAARQPIKRLSLFQALSSGSVLLFIAAVSWWLELGLNTPLLVAYCRAGGQLTVLGFILTPILLSNSIPVTLVTMSVMLFIASQEVVSRSKATFPGMVWVVAASMGVGVIANLTLAMLLFIKPEPLWAPIYVIPMFGMTLGNALTAVTLGLGTVIEAMHGDGARDVESLLCHGATGWEATLPLVTLALTKGLVPTINNMNVIGLVFLPGMMVGQLLAGADASQACYYQMLIIFLIASSSCLSLLIGMVITMRTLMDSEHRLHKELITVHAASKDPLIRLLRALRSLFLFLGAWQFLALLFGSVAVGAAVASDFQVFPGEPLGRISYISMAASGLMIVGAVGQRALIPSKHKLSEEDEPLLPRV
ncbi:UPF0014 membrane protein [Diplonema papillatum]|nr:UPF0014 membrane protein [Diplonema papillatum]